MPNRRFASDVCVYFTVLGAVKCTRVSLVTRDWHVDDTLPSFRRHRCAAWDVARVRIGALMPPYL